MKILFKYFIIFCIGLCCLNAGAQNETKKWYSGFGAGAAGGNNAKLINSVPGNKSSNSAVAASPNPVVDKLHLKFADSHNQIKVEVLDIMGKKLFESTVKGSEADLDIDLKNLGLKDGIYFVKTTGNGTSQTNKIMYNNN